MDRRKLRNTQPHDNPRDDSGSGKFLVICGCVNHDVWTYDKIFQIRNIKRSHIFASGIIRQMINCSLLSKKSRNLCTVCYHAFKNR